MRKKILFKRKVKKRRKHHLKSGKVIMIDILVEDEMREVCFFLSLLVGCYFW